MKAHPEYLGTKVEDGELPVLVKFIDAKKDLSVQVHPSDEYAREHEGDNGKTEMWYVIDADEGASLIYGFQHEVTEEILRKAVETEHWTNICKRFQFTKAIHILFRQERYMVSGRVFWLLKFRKART